MKKTNRIRTVCFNPFQNILMACLTLLLFGLLTSTAQARPALFDLTLPFVRISSDGITTGRAIGLSVGAHVFGTGAEGGLNWQNGNLEGQGEASVLGYGAHAGASGGSGNDLTPNADVTSDKTSIGVQGGVLGGKVHAGLHNHWDSPEDTEN